MKKIILSVFIVSVLLCAIGLAQAQPFSRTLVVYFSATGTTKAVAQEAVGLLGADLYEIVPAQPYTEADLAYYTNGRCDQEQADPSVRPGIAGEIPSMGAYDTVLIGYPIWHGQAPRIICTFLEKCEKDLPVSVLPIQAVWAAVRPICSRLSPLPPSGWKAGAFPPAHPKRM